MWIIVLLFFVWLFWQPITKRLSPYMPAEGFRVCGCTIIPSQTAIANFGADEVKSVHRRQLELVINPYRWPYSGADLPLTSLTTPDMIEQTE